MSKFAAQRTAHVGIGAALAGCCLVAILVGAAVWQKTVHDSSASDAESHSTTASRLQDARTEGTAAGDLLKQYVATGDQTLLPQIQSHTTTGVRTLTSAVTQAGGDTNGFIAGGSRLADGAGQIIAMRQSGDVKGAVTALNDLGPKFTAFIAAQDQVIASERAEAAAQQDGADSAETAALWLALSAGAVGFGLVLGAFVLIGHRLMRRRTVGTVSSA